MDMSRRRRCLTYAVLTVLITAGLPAFGQTPWPTRRRAAKRQYRVHILTPHMVLSRVTSISRPGRSDWRTVWSPGAGWSV